MNNIEVILDVVYNHTGSDCSLLTISKRHYYICDGNNNTNYSGCGNTYNTNNPIAKELIINSLRYWVSEMNVDGFRFDEGTILLRGQDGKQLPNPPIIEEISLDPILSKTRLIMEPWDAGGLFCEGNIPYGYRWSDWNGTYRDDV